MRSRPVEAGRSINLALSDRGLKALRLVGLEDQVREKLIPMRGRLIHNENGESWLSPYSGREKNFINSVSRPGLNMELLDEADSYPNLTIQFGCKCLSVDFSSGEAQFLNEETDEVFSDRAAFVFAGDGAGSAVRRSYLAKSTQLRFDYEQDFLDHGYKELTIPPGPNGTWRMEKNALHIWPRQDYMLIALPNLDGSFTVTLFLSFEGDPGFHALRKEADVKSFFQTVFPTAYQHMPTLADDFFTNPTGTLGTIRCSPWSTEKTLLMGDAAHAIVPFYGQGMNCALEDVVVFDKLIDEYNGNWSKIAPAYEKQRKKATDAIARLALDNYFEMRDHVDNPEFIKKRKLEMALESQFPDYFSKYSLVTFNEDISYDIAKAQGEKQDAFLLDFCKNISDTSTVDISSLYQSIKSAIS